MRLLFVDDETLILTGLENSMIFAPDGWSADFAVGGQAALDLLATNEYDVLVTDMRMPQIDGADVLERAKSLHPEMLRVVLTGEVDCDLAERAMPLAHDFVSKPCDPDQLFGVITRLHTNAAALRGPWVTPGILDIVGELPAQPALYARVQGALVAGDDAAAVASLIENDLAMASTIVKIANSAFYGFRTPASSVQEAVGRLGIEAVAGIVLSTELAGMTPPGLVDVVEQINLHSTAASNALRTSIGREIRQAPLAGLLHDVGLLVLLGQFGSEYQALLTQMAASATRIDDSTVEGLERARFGVSHAEVGAAVLALWNSDPLIVEVAAFHHRPEDASDPARRVIEIIESVESGHGAPAATGDASASMPAGEEVFVGDAGAGGE